MLDPYKRRPARTAIGSCDLPDLAAARAFALRLIGRMLDDDAASGQINLGRKIAITDKDGRDLLIVSFRDAL